MLPSGAAPYQALCELISPLMSRSPTGRIFRLAAGTGFLVVGYKHRGHPLAKLSMAWGILPLSAGALDICYVSAVLGGPLSGAKIRSLRGPM